jgi:hypothetical protein
VLARPKARANQRHNSLNRRSVSITAHSLSPANGHPTHEEVQYEAQLRGNLHSGFLPVGFFRRPLRIYQV